MKNITKKNLAILERDIELALQMVAEQHGLYYSRGRGTYTSDKFDGKYKFQTRHEDGVPSDFARNARDFGFCPSIWGRTFTTAKGKFKILEINPRKTKYPVSARDTSTGLMWDFALGMVRRALQAG